MPLAVATRTADDRLYAGDLDDEGFLTEHRLWNRTLAQQLADRHGLGRLGVTHWLMIDFVRDRYARFGALPPTRNPCRLLGVDHEAVKKAFGGCRQLWQIAGLPNVGEQG